MTWRRAAATCLLVLCLSVSGVLHFASQSHLDAARGQVSQPGISAPDSELALALANKIENPSGSELTPAVFDRLNFLRRFSENGGNLRLVGDRCLPNSVEPAIEIRGPPYIFLS